MLTNTRIMPPLLMANASRLWGRCLAPEIPVPEEVSVRCFSVLFADIADFTAIAETIDPLDTFAMLNRYLGRLREIAQSHGGQVDIIGDGLMALFGLDDPEAAEGQSVRAGLDLLRACRTLNEDQPRQFGDLRLRVGVHSGRAAVGFIASGQGPRLTAIGRTINVAKRIEMANKSLGTRLLISHRVYSRLDDEVAASRFEGVSLRGVSRPITLYEVKARCPSYAERTGAVGDVAGASSKGLHA